MPFARSDNLRVRHGHDHHRVTYIELFFDLVFVFAITQLSHGLLHHLTPLGALETALLMIAVTISPASTEKDGGGGSMVGAVMARQCSQPRMDAPRGFEPRLTESESVVLPLDDGAAWEAAR